VKLVPLPRGRRALLALCMLGALLVPAAVLAAHSSAPQAQQRPHALTAAAVHAQAARVFSTRGTIVRLAADGARVAASTRGIKGACDRIVVWSAPGKTFRRFDAHTHCPKSDVPVFEYIGEIALGGGRIAWIEGGGGNNLELSLYAAPLSGGPKSSKSLDFAGNHAGAEGSRTGDWVGQLFGAGPVLAYNRWHECWREHDDDTACPVNGEVSKQKLLRIGSAKPVAIRSGPSAWELLAVGSGRLAIVSRGATAALGDAIAVRNASGALVATIPAKPNGPVRAVAVTTSHVVVQPKRLQPSAALDWYDAGSGQAAGTLQLGASDSTLQMVGANSSLALLRGLHRLRLVRLSDGKRITLPLEPGVGRCSCPVDARLTESGLFYAYNVAKNSAHGRIVFWPTVQLLARF